MKPSPPQVLIIGIGQEWRGDDAAGLLVARQLRRTAGSGVTVLENSGALTDLLAAWQGAEAAILVDALTAGSPPGEIYRFPVHEKPLPPDLFPAASSHAWGVARALALGRVLRQLPPYLVVYGISGRDFGLGAGLSAEVARALPEASRQIRQEVEAYLERPPTARCQVR